MINFFDALIFLTVIYFILYYGATYLLIEIGLFPKEWKAEFPAFLKYRQKQSLSLWNEVGMADKVIASAVVLALHPTVSFNPNEFIVNDLEAKTQVQFLVV